MPDARKTETPPFRGLYALVKVARHGRFGTAAEELDVTVSAVSHQIKSVEDWVGARLLDRKTRSPKPTQIGQRLIDGIAPSFTRIEEACLAAKRGSDSRKVVVSCPTDFASFLLMPLLSEFWHTNPEIDVDVRLTSFDAPLAEVSSDVSIRFLHDTNGGTALGPRGWSAVGSRAYVEGLGRPAQLADITSGELYHEAIYNYWPECFALEELAVPDDVALRGIGDTGHVLMAVMSGTGLALAPKALTHRLIEDGLLVSAFDVGIERDATYVAFAESPIVRKQAAGTLLTWLVRNFSRAPAQTRQVADWD